jgi:hypothetical protein
MNAAASDHLRSGLKSSLLACAHFCVCVAGILQSTDSKYNFCLRGFKNNQVMDLILLEGDSFVKRENRRNCLLDFYSLLVCEAFRPGSGVYIV